MIVLVVFGDLNITENGRNETKIIARKIVEYFNSSTKHTGYEDEKVALDGVLSDLSIEDIIEFVDLNGNETNALVNNLKTILLSMSKYEDDLVLKRSSLMMLLNVHNLNISMLSKLIGVNRKSCSIQ